MRRRISLTLAVTVMVSASTAALPASGGLLGVPIGAVSNASAAAVGKSLAGEGGGGGSVNGAGSRLSDLLSGWAVPVLIVLAGCLLVGTLTQRNIGASVGIVLITLIGLIFLLSPQSIESLAKNVANVVF
jgi:hypothetical protein